MAPLKVCVVKESKERQRFRQVYRIQMSIQKVTEEYFIKELFSLRREAYLSAFSLRDILLIVQLTNELVMQFQANRVDRTQDKVDRTQDKSSLSMATILIENISSICISRWKFAWNYKMHLNFPSTHGQSPLFQVYISSKTMIDDNYDLVDLSAIPKNKICTHENVHFPIPTSLQDIFKQQIEPNLEVDANWYTNDALLNQMPPLRDMAAAHSIATSLHSTDEEINSNAGGPSNAITANHSPRNRQRTKRKNFPQETKKALKECFENQTYPSRAIKLELCRKTHLTLYQVDNWFANERRIKKALGDLDE